MNNSQRRRRIKAKYYSLIEKHGLADIIIREEGVAIVFGRKFKDEHGQLLNWRHCIGGPAVIHLNDDNSEFSRSYYQNNVLHREDGPALVRVINGKEVEWEKNPCMYYLHGVLVNDYVVMEPHKITVEAIESDVNLERKRVMIERFGWIRYLSEKNAKIVDRQTDEISGTNEVLFKVSLGTRLFGPLRVNRPQMRRRVTARVLVCSCPSTGRVYIVEVPSFIKTCEDAQSWLRGDRLNEVNLIGAS